MSEGNESNSRRSASNRQYALVTAVALVAAVVVPWIGVAFADGGESAHDALSTVDSTVPDPTTETDGTNDSTDPLPTTVETTTETTTESDDPPADPPDDSPGDLPWPGDPMPNETTGENRSDGGNESGPPDERDPPVNSSDPPENRTGPPTNGTGPPGNETGPPGNETGPPANRTGPPTNRTDLPANRTDPPANRTGPPNGTGPVNGTGPANGTPGVGPRGNTPSANATTVNVTVENATANQPVSVNVSRSERRNDSVAFDSVSVTPAENGSFTLNTTASREPIADRTPTTDLPNGTESLQYLSVDHSIDDENISEVTFRFRVRKDRVNDSERDDVVLYRFKNGSWNELPTAHVETTDTHYVYRVRSPGLSEFAAGKQTAQFEITNATVAVRTLSVEDALKVRVRVTNEGDADGTFTAELALDDDPVANRHLSIAAGGMRQATFERTVSRPGTYEVYVNDYRVGEVTVNETAATGGESTGSWTSDRGAETEGDGADRTGSDVSASTPGFGLATAVATLLVLLLAVCWREW